ncbi:hypothetical protein YASMINEVIRUS_1440, partial [Yasminevirus sp. GU-2018]
LKIVIISRKMEKIVSHLLCPSCGHLLLDPVMDVEGGPIYNRSCFIKILKTRAETGKGQCIDHNDWPNTTSAFFSPVLTIRNLVFDMIQNTDFLTEKAKKIPVNLIIESKIPSSMLKYFTIPDNFNQLVINYNSQKIYNALKSKVYTEEFLLNSFTEDLIRGIDFTYIDIRTKNSILITACRAPYPEIALTIIKYITNNFAQDVVLRMLNHVNHNFDTALTVSARRGLSDVVSALVKVNGVDINHVNRFGRSALFYMAGNSMEENLLCSSHLTHLSPSATSCEKVTLSLLDDYPVNYNQCDIIGTSVLMNACKNVSLNIVRKLLEKKDINVNHQNDEKNTALMYLCHMDAQTIDNLLFDSLNKCSKGHCNVVKECKRLAEDVASLVLDVLKIQHIDIDCTNDHGYDALAYAVRTSDDVSIKLIDMGAPVDRVYSGGNTVLLTACNEGNIKVVAKLLSLSKDVLINHRDEEGFDALIELCAVVARNREQITQYKLFLENKTDRKTEETLREYIVSLTKSHDDAMNTIIMLVNHPDFVVNEESLEEIKLQFEPDSTFNSGSGSSDSVEVESVSGVDSSASTTTDASLEIYLKSELEMDYDRIMEVVRSKQKTQTRSD